MNGDPLRQEYLASALNLSPHNQENLFTCREKERDSMPHEFEQYIRFERQFAQSTVAYYLTFFRHFREYSATELKKDILDCTRDDICSFLAHLRNKGVSVSSVSNYITVLRCFYQWAAYKYGGEKLLSVSFYVRSILKTKKEWNPVVVPTPQEIEKIRGVLGEHLRMYRAEPESIWYRKAVEANVIFELLITTGMRSGELRNITLKDIQLPEKTITIRKGKGSRWRYTYMTDTLVSLMKEHIAAADISDAGFIFSTRSNHALNHLIRRWAKRAGIDKQFHAHSFRHYFITAAQAQVQSDEVVADLVGHSSIVSTRRYTHFNQSVLRSKYDSIKV